MRWTVFFLLELTNVPFHLIHADNTLTTYNSYSGQNSQVVNLILQSKIVPDVIDTPPQQQIMVVYNGAKSVSFGNEMKPAEVQVQPDVSWPVSSTEQLYTVVELDPDAPSAANITYRSILQWMINNIPGTDVTSGDVYASYMGSLPPPGSGLKRYVFLVFPQTRRLTLTPLPSGNVWEPRLRFDMRDFMRQNGLGQPVAGNYYLAQADEFSIQAWASIAAGA